MLAAARGLGVEIDEDGRDRRRRAHFHFDPALKLMSTIDAVEDGSWVHTKGAPEAVCRAVASRSTQMARARSTKPSGAG